MSTQAQKPRRIPHWWAEVVAAGHTNAHRTAAGRRPRPVYPKRYVFLEQSGMAREMGHL